MVLIAAALVAGCSSSPSSRAATCRSLCRGTLAGAQYLIRRPAHWNGTLLLYSHGYRSPGSADVARPSLDLTETGGDADDPITSALLAQGYALAGSGSAEQGWSTGAAVRAADELYRHAVRVLGRPRRTYVWGGSFGGLVTQLIAERATWVDGAAPMCGAVAGPLDNFDNLLEALWATRTLLLPQLRVTGLATESEARAQAASLGPALTAALTRPGGAAAITYVAGLVGLPAASAQHPSGAPLAALADSVVTYDGFALGLLFDLEQHFGGNPARTTAPGAPSAALAAAVSAAGGDAATLATTLAAAPAITADPAARAAAASASEPTGRLRVPTVTLHGEADPIVVAANETALADRVRRAGAGARLRQFYAPALDTASGIGHCVFTRNQVVDTLAALDAWVRTGRRPSAPAGLTAAFTPVTWSVA